MLTTYQAELYQGKINWIGKKPKEISNNKTYKIEIQILQREEDKQVNNDLVEFFQNSPLYAIELDLDRAKDTSRELVL